MEKERKSYGTKFLARFAKCFGKENGVRYDIYRPLIC